MWQKLKVLSSPSTFEWTCEFCCYFTKNIFISKRNCTLGADSQVMLCSRRSVCESFPADAVWEQEECHPGSFCGFSPSPPVLLTGGGFISRASSQRKHHTKPSYSQIINYRNPLCNTPTSFFCVCFLSLSSTLISCFLWKKLHFSRSVAFLTRQQESFHLSLTATGLVPLKGFFLLFFFFLSNLYLQFYLL